MAAGRKLRRCCGSNASSCASSTLNGCAQREAWSRNLSKAENMPIARRLMGEAVLELAHLRCRKDMGVRELSGWERKRDRSMSQN